MRDEVLMMIFAAIGLLMVFASPFVAFWNFGAAVLFLIVGIGTLVGIGQS